MVFLRTECPSRTARRVKLMCEDSCGRVRRSFTTFTVYVDRLFSPIAHQSAYISYPSHFLKYRATETIRLSSCCCSPRVKKKQDTKLLAITSPIIIRFSNFFSLKDSVVNLQQTPFKNFTTLETCRYTTL